MMPFWYKSKWFWLSLPALVLISVRAVELSITFDEAWSVVGYVTDAWTNIVLNSNPAANNHILMSLLMKVSYTVFGFHEWVFRLPSLLAFVGYSYFGWIVCNRILSNRGWAVFLVLIYQPYLLDYFGAARGYALALAAMMATIHFAMEFQLSKRNLHLTGFLASGFIMVYANFTFLLVYFGQILVLIVYHFVTNNNISKKHWFALILGFIVTLSIIGYPLYQLIIAGELYYGGRNNPYSDTLLSLSKALLYQRGQSHVLAIFLLMIFLACVGILRKALFQKNVQYGSLLLLLPSVLVENIMQHILFDTPYLAERTGMMLVPLYIMCFFVLLDHLVHFNWYRKFLILVVTLNLIYAVSCFNLKYMCDFHNDADFKEAMAVLKEECTERISPFILGKSIYMNAEINYYKEQFKMDFIKQSGLEFCDEGGTHPYYYLFKEDLNCVSESDVEIIKLFPETGSALFLRRSLIKEIRVN